MFCPKCGQQQVSEEMRFCPRCGLQLEAVTALLAGGGLPAPVSNATGEKPSAKKRGVRQGAKLMFTGGVLLPVAFGFSLVVDSPIPLIIPLTIFLAGLAWMLYFRLFSEEPEQGFAQSSQLGRAHQAFLPTHQSIPAQGLNKTPASTAEMTRPPSVTEHTTKLLNVDEGKG